MAEHHGDRLGLKHRTADVLRALLAASHHSQERYDAAGKILWERRREVEARADEGPGYSWPCSDLLKPLFGNSINRKWNGTPFQHSLEISYKPAEVNVPLSLWALFLEKHPELQLAEMNVTAVRAEKWSQQLMDAIGAVASQKVIGSASPREEQLFCGRYAKGCGI